MTSVFTVEGGTTVDVMIRAVGPRLADFGVIPTVSDPVIQLFNATTGVLIGENDNWDASLESEFFSLGLLSLSSGSKDAALLVSLPAGTYEVRVSDQGDSDGNVLLELNSRIGASRLVYGNVRFKTTTSNMGNQVGVYLTGTDSSAFLFRALGDAQGASDAVPDPYLSLSGNIGGFLQGGRGWSEGTAEAGIAGLKSLEIGSADATIARQLGSEVYTLFVAPQTGASSEHFQIIEFAAVDENRNDTLVAAIVSQPRSQEPEVGSAFSLGVVANGIPAPTFQWFKDEQAVAGETGASLAVSVSELSDAGDFHVEVVQGAVRITSETASVLFAGRPVIEENLPHVLANLGERVDFNEFGRQDGVVREWFLDGDPIDAGESGDLVIVPFAASDAGEYLLRSSNDSGIASSQGSIRARGRMDSTDRWIVVGDDGVLLTSLDGNTWTPGASGTSENLTGVSSNGLITVVVGENGTMLRSEDGEIWTAVPLATTLSLRGIVHSQTQFVAVGDEGVLLTSIDGLEWTQGRIPTNLNRDLNDIVYAHGRLVAVGDNGAVFRSLDGSDWTNWNSETLEHIVDVGFAGVFWLEDATGRFATSGSGRVWQPIEGALPGWIRALQANGREYLAVGNGGRLRTSPDTVAWDSQETGTFVHLNDATWSGAPVFVEPGFEEIASALDMRILKQPLATTAKLGGSATFKVELSGGGYDYQWLRNSVPIAGATGAILSLVDLQVDDVGDYSVHVTGLDSVITSSAVPLAFRGSGDLGAKFIVVGSDGVILTSEDGALFDSQFAPGSPDLRAVVASAFQAVAVGTGGDILRSTNGENWNRVDSPTELILRGVTTGPNQFVAVGSSGSIFVSEDAGQTWTATTSGTSLPLWSVAWNGMYFLAVGEDGVVLRSTDGWAWTTETSPTSKRLYAIGLNGSQFLAISEDGESFTTLDGATWQPGTISGSWWVRSAVIGDQGKRIVAGDFGLLASSDDGLDWSRLSTPTFDRLSGVTWTGPLAPAIAGLSEAMLGPELKILTPPADATVTVGGTAAFTVEVTGLHPLAYQWKYNGTSLEGATSATLLLGNVQASQAGAYSVVVSSVTGLIQSTPATLTVEDAPPGIPPEISSQPTSQSAFVGGEVSFSVSAGGDLPIEYQWSFNGSPVFGANRSALVLSNLQLVNAGSYRVTITNSFGSVKSMAAQLTVSNAVGAPVITLQPQGMVVSSGTSIEFSVTAMGDGELSYQWRRNGVALAGEVSAALVLESVSTADAGEYSVSISNASGMVISNTVGLTVVPAGMSASQATTRNGYLPGELLTISNSLSYVGEAEAMGWDVLLPTGWSFVESGGVAADVQPSVGDTDVLGWAWQVVPSSPLQFDYTLRAPVDATGSHSISAIAIVRQGGLAIEFLADPEPLRLVPLEQFHSADTNGDNLLELNELLRVIELYNTRNGSERTGRYQLQPDSGDGFSSDPDSAPDATVILGKYHNADFNRDAKIGLSELLRVIELYNYREGTRRTGEYHFTLSDTDDGFERGPAP